MISEKTFPTFPQVFHSNQHGQRENCSLMLFLQTPIFPFPGQLIFCLVKKKKKKKKEFEFKHCYKAFK
jgi:hypothetical protein